MQEEEMKEMEAAMKISEDRKLITPPPTPPPLPSFWLRKPAPTWSATKEEIAMFWRRKKTVEEEHFLAAIKEAARKRAARNLSEEDYMSFEERLNDVEDNTESTTDEKKGNDNDNKEIRIGIKDWWTKSKYAYLNLPATESVGKQKKTSTYIPHSFSYKAIPQSQHAQLGVF